MTACSVTRLGLLWQVRLELRVGEHACEFVDLSVLCRHVVRQRPVLGTLTGTVIVTSHSQLQHKCNAHACTS